MSKLRPPRLKRLKTPAHIKITKPKPFVNIYFEEFLPKYLNEKLPQINIPATLKCKRDDHVITKKLAHVIRIFTGSKTTPTATSMNELQLEILRLRQQVNTYKAMITNHEQLPQEIHEWRNRFTTESEMYENVYAVILDKLAVFAYYLRTSLRKPRVNLLTCIKKLHLL